MSKAPLLLADRAAFQYAGRGRPVGPFDLQVGASELHLVSGPSGCGKSTLARLCAGLVPHLYRGHTTGRVLVDGQPTTAQPLWRLAARIGFVGQNPAAQLLASTVRDELLFGLETLGLGPADVANRLGAALDTFGLHTVAERDPRTLSGGEQQKVVLAALMARRPGALVLDEPLSMLDTAAATATVAELARLRAGGTAVVVCEHRHEAFAGLPHVTRTDLPSPASVEHALPLLEPRIPAFRIVVEGLGVTLGGRTVLEDVTLTLAGGQVVSVIGANGAGKTTLLRALAGLQPHHGRINGFASRPQHPRLGMCFQNPDRQLFTPTVRDELRYGRPHCAEDAYQCVLALLGLTRYEQTPPLLLSEGEKKRLGLGIMLLTPGLSGLCLDEPTLGQDDAHRRLLGRVARRLADAGYLCVVATHDLGWAAEWSDQLYVLHDGRLVASDRPRALLGDRPLRTEPGQRAPDTGHESCRVDAHSR